MFAFDSKPRSSAIGSSTHDPLWPRPTKAPSQSPDWFGLAASKADLEAKSSPPVVPGTPFNFARIPIAPPSIRGNLVISSPSEPYEHEADKVAGKVMRMLDPSPTTFATAIPGKHGPYGNDKERIQTQGTPSTKIELAAALENTVRVSRRGGDPLPEATRSFFEPRFGHDFSRVRVHTDGQAADAARAVHARAYTLGSNIVFGPGEYVPGTTEGKRLLAHELTHVVQQSAPAHATHGLWSGTPPMIQRKLVATGDPAGFAALVNSIITTQLQLKVDKAGQVSLDATNIQGPPTREAQALTETLRRIISDPKTTTIAFIHGDASPDPIDQQVMIGSYAAARIDLDDLGKLGSGEGISGGSALAHELTEQHRRQVFAENYPTAHAAGMAEEETVTGARRGASTRRQIDATSYEIEVAYHYPDHTVFVTRVVRNQNIVAVTRRTTRP